MSHVTEISTPQMPHNLPMVADGAAREILLAVKFKNLPALKQTLESIGRITDTFGDYSGKTYKADIVIRTDDFPRGIGFVFENGEYKPKADIWQYQTQAHNLLNRIKQGYTQAVLTGALKKQQYTVSTKTDGGVVKIHARRY